MGLQGPEGCQRAASGLPVRSGVVGLRTLELAEEALRGIYVQACVVSVATRRLAPLATRLQGYYSRRLAPQDYY